MKNHRIILGTLALSVVAMLSSCHKEGKLSMEFPEKFEGKTVELIEYMDSTVLASAVVKDGKAEFVTKESFTKQFPFFAQVMVDGRTKAYYIAESGKATVTDSTSIAKGTPYNDKLAALIERLDSVDNLDNMPEYIRFVEQEYNANKENVLADFLGVEYIKFAEPAKVDSFLNVSHDGFRDTKRAKSLAERAKHRQSTAPGNKYLDIPGEDVQGRTQKLSRMIVPGHYTLIDMWASWCPYCIRELPALKEMYAEYGDKGLDIIGVAVRDLTEDTRQMVEKQEIPWKVLYNTQKVPYDLYGFSGIPYHILLGPDGSIISRGENVDQIRARLQETLQ